MSTRPHDPSAPAGEERLEYYLDGLLTGENKAAFEAQIAADPRLKGEVEAHQRMCAGLRSLTAVGQAPAVSSTLKLAGESAPNAKHSRRWVRIAAIAACIGIPAAAGVFWVLAPKPAEPVKFAPLTSEQYQQKHRDLMLAEYKSQVASGFKPKEVCNTDEQFVDWTTKKLGHGLRPVHGAKPGDPAEPVLAGWSVGNTFSAYTGLLLAQVDGKPVMVVMDEAPPERMVPKDDATGMPRMFRRNVNGVWMIEITPLDQPRVITRIEAAS